jgi:hypothetical protein
LQTALEERSDCATDRVRHISYIVPVGVAAAWLVFVSIVDICLVRVCLSKVLSIQFSHLLLVALQVNHATVFHRVNHTLVSIATVFME